MGKAVPLRRAQRASIKNTYSRPESTGATRAFFLEAMIAVANGKMDFERAQSIARLGQQAYNFSKLELRAAEISAKYGDRTINSWEFKRDPPAVIDGSEQDDEQNPDD